MLSFYYTAANKCQYFNSVRIASIKQFYGMQLYDINNICKTKLNNNKIIINQSIINLKIKNIKPIDYD